MSLIEEVARDTLTTAHDTLAKARRSLLLAAGLLALLHLLTVHPYLKAAREIAEIEASRAANTALLSELEPEIENLRAASDKAVRMLDALLDKTTNRMVTDFADLRALVQYARSGDFDPGSPPGGSNVALPGQMQQMQQMEIPNPPPQQQMQGPPPEQRPSPGSTGPGIPYWPPRFGPELQPILEAIAAGDPNAYERLIEFARTTIVRTAYADAQEEWIRTIQPAYLFALRETANAARRLAEHAPVGEAGIAAELVAAADKLTGQFDRIEAVEIRHDASVDAALGSDWWHTVQGKGAYGDAVSESIHIQLSEIGAIAEAPSASIARALVLQESLRDELKALQASLEEQFGEQRKQLASLSGLSAAVPVDLASFIGLFPLVLGLVLGLFMLRAGQARREAAEAATDLAEAAPDDRETRRWLAARALGAKRAQGPVTVAVLAAVASVAWIGLAGLQVAHSIATVPLSPWLSGAIAVALIVAATGWDVMSMRRLAAESRR